MVVEVVVVVRHKYYGMLCQLSQCPQQCGDPDLSRPDLLSRLPGFPWRLGVSPAEQRLVADRAASPNSYSVDMLVQSTEYLST